MATKASHRRAVMAGVLIFLAAASMFFFFPPTQYSFYPQCPIHRYFGILCPGCGTTRALAALLRGHFLEALHFNALTILSLPFVAAWTLFSRKQPRISIPTVCAAFAITAVFTIARNL